MSDEDRERSPYDPLTPDERRVLANSRLARSPQADEIRRKIVWPEPSAVGRLRQAYRPRPGITLRPPPDDAVVAVDPGHAYRIAGMGDQHRGPTIMLALASVEPPPQRIVNRLVQVVRWDDVTWLPSGPPPGSGPARGMHLVLVDALTGEILLNLLTGTVSRPG